MNQPRYQHLTDAFNSIISMMLASLRVRGWRGLLDIPSIIVVSIYLRRLGREFGAMIANLDLTGIDLTALPPAPVATSAEADARPASAPRARPSRAERPTRARATAALQPGPAAPTPVARRQRTPDPRAIPVLRAIPGPRAGIRPRETARTP